MPRKFPYTYYIDGARKSFIDPATKWGLEATLDRLIPHSKSVSLEPHWVFTEAPHRKQFDIHSPAGIQNAQAIGWNLPEMIAYERRAEAKRLVRNRKAQRRAPFSSARKLKVRLLKRK